MADRTSRVGKSAELDAPPADKLIESLLRLINRGGESLGMEVTALAKTQGDGVYVELLYLLSHLRLEAKEARECWTAILELRSQMQARLGTAVDARVALVSYFLDVNRKLKNPKLIELQLFQETQASAYRDDLTGLYNYRYFREHLSKEVERAERTGSPLSLVMIDIDDFKQYNDKFGHPAGNEALVDMARLVQLGLRKIDTAVRYGGEEFALLLPATPKDMAVKVADRVCKRISSSSAGKAQDRGPLTVSMGVATYPADAHNGLELVRNADSALYVAKSRGKNRVVLFGENRRSHRRLKANLQGSIRVIEAEARGFTTLDLSESGMLFRTDRKLALGSLLDVALEVPDGHPPVTAAGRVIRVEEKGPGRYDTAVLLVKLGPRDRERVAKFVRAGSR